MQGRHLLQAQAADLGDALFLEEGGLVGAPQGHDPFRPSRYPVVGLDQVLDQTCGQILCQAAGGDDEEDALALIAQGTLKGVALTRPGGRLGDAHPGRIVDQRPLEGGQAVRSGGDGMTGDGQCSVHCPTSTAASSKAIVGVSCSW